MNTEVHVFYLKSMLDRLTLDLQQAGYSTSAMLAAAARVGMDDTENEPIRIHRTINEGGE